MDIILIFAKWMFLSWLGIASVHWRWRVFCLVFYSIFVIWQLYWLLWWLYFLMDGLLKSMIF